MINFIHLGVHMLIPLGPKTFEMPLKHFPDW